MLGWFLFLLWLLWIAGFYFFAGMNGERQLRDWCEKHEYKIEQLERRHFRQGPFLSWFSIRQSVFFVSVRDSSDLRLESFVRCGHWLWGALAGEVEPRLCKLDGSTKEFPIR
jgi:hypothetical protein